MYAGRLLWGCMNYLRGPVMKRVEELTNHGELFKEKILVPRFDFAEAAVPQA